MPENVTDAAKATPQALHIVLPVLNDWEACAQLLKGIAQTAQAHNLAPSIIVVDDGSTQPVPENFTQQAAPYPVHILKLKRNCGHQGALALALSWLQASGNPATPAPIVLMDADGQDKPGQIPLLLETFLAEGGTKAVFAQRSQRSEPLWFRFFYALYLLMLKLLTQRSQKVGNFSIIPWHVASQLILSSELWVRYSATVDKLRIPTTSVALPRGARTVGESQMSFLSLCLFGLRAVAVQWEFVALRLFFLSFFASAGLLTAGALVWLLGGSPWLAGFLAIVAAQASVLAACFIASVLAYQSQPSFIPARDYKHFIQT